MKFQYLLTSLIMVLLFAWIFIPDKFQRHLYREVYPHIYTEEAIVPGWLIHRGETF